MIVETLRKNLYETVGEGPCWDGRTKEILSVDGATRTLHKWHTETNTVDSVKIPGEGVMQFIIPRRSGGYVIGDGSRVAHFDWDINALTTLADVSSLQKNAAFNDAKCDARGRLFAGTIHGKDVPSLWEETPPPGGLFSLNLSLELKQQSRGNSFSNGIAWTSDSRRIFHINSLDFKLLTYDYDIESGDLSNECVAVDLHKLVEQLPGRSEALFGHPAGSWFPDGCSMDVHDKLWVACAKGSRVIRIDPETGSLLETVDIPADNVSSCCFGGPDLSELYVTTICKFSPESPPPTNPLDGTFYRVRGLPSRGAPVAMFEG